MTLTLEEILGEITAEEAARIDALVAESDARAKANRGKRHLPPLLAARAESDLPTADEASQINMDVAAQFVTSSEAAVWVLESDTATGKSRAMIKRIAEQAKADPDFRVLAQFESHKMLAEVEQKLTAEGVDVHTYRGEEQRDPRFADEDGVTLGLMCRRSGARQEARKAGNADLACVGCPFAPSEASAAEACGYKMQAGKAAREISAAAQVVLIAGEAAFSTRALPGSIARANDWRPVVRGAGKLVGHDDEGQPLFAKGAPVIDQFGDPVPNIHAASRAELRKETGGKAIGEHDFTHVWRDEFSPAAMVEATSRTNVYALNMFDDVLAGAYSLAPVVLDDAVKTFARAMVERKMAVSQPMAAAYAGEGEVDSTALINEVRDWCKSKLAALGKVLEAAARGADGDLPGSVSLAALKDAGLCVDALAVLRAVAWRLVVKPEFALGEMTAAEIAEEMTPFVDHNKQARAMAGLVGYMLKAVARWSVQVRAATEAKIDEVMASGWHTRRFDAERYVWSLIDRGELPAADDRAAIPGVFAEVAKDEDGQVAGAAVRFALRRDLGPLVKAVPTMITSAQRDRGEMQDALGADVAISYHGVARVRDGEGVVRTQREDTTMSKAALVPRAGSASYEKNAVRAMRVALDSLFTMAAGGGVLGQDKAGLVTFKDTVAFLRRAMPAANQGLILGSYGSVTGSNDWEGVKALTIAGRPSASVRALEDSTIGLTGAQVTRAQKDGQGRVMLGRAVHHTGEIGDFGEAVGRLRECHGDPLVERTRASITEESVMQAEARGRAARRTADNPLHVNVLTNTPTGREIDVNHGWSAWRHRSGFIALPLALGVWPAKAEDGKQNLRGWLFQLAGRAGLAALGNASGEMPDGIEENPALLCSHGPSANPTHCAKIMDMRIQDSSEFALIMNQIDSLLQHGKDGDVHLLGGATPFRAGGWHLVEADASGRPVSVWARGADKAEAQRRAEEVLAAGVEAIRGDLDRDADLAASAEGQAVRKAVVPAETRAAEVAVERFRSVWEQSGVMALTARQAVKWSPSTWPSRGAADKDLLALHAAYTGDVISGGDIERAFVGEEGDTVALAASMLAATADGKTQRSAVLVEIVDGKSGSRPVQVLLDLDHSSVDEIAVYFRGGMLAAHESALASAVRDAEARVQRAEGALGAALDALEAQKARVEAAKVARKAGEITEKQKREITAAATIAKQTAKEAKAELAAAKKALKGAIQRRKSGESKLPDAVEALETFIPGFIERKHGLKVRSARIIHAFAPGLHIDHHATLCEEQVAAEQERLIFAPGLFPSPQEWEQVESIETLESRLIWGRDAEPPDWSKVA